VDDGRRDLEVSFAAGLVAASSARPSPVSGRARSDRRPRPRLVRIAAPRCTLLVYVDDATGRLMQLRFAESESSFSYFEATHRYLEQHGRPVAFYSDKAGIFRNNAKQSRAGNGITQFARALGELNIDIVFAHSPQAKGRVERAHQTLQDRLPTSGPRAAAGGRCATRRQQLPPLRRRRLLRAGGCGRGPAPGPPAGRLPWGRPGSACFRLDRERREERELRVACGLGRESVRQAERNTAA
jgi:hypothetical protein